MTTIFELPVTEPDWRIAFVIEQEGEQVDEQVGEQPLIMLIPIRGLMIWDYKAHI